MKRIDQTKQQLLEEIKHLRKQIKEYQEREKQFSLIEGTFQESKETLHSIFNNVGIGISLISPKMEILSLNQQMREWFPNIDVRKKPICYKSYKTPPQEHICSYCPTIKTLKDGKIHKAISLTLRNGKIRHHRIISSPVKDLKGNIVCAVEIVEDITEQKQTEETLQAREELLKLILESTADGILVVNKDGRISHFNQKFIEMWKIPPSHHKIKDDNLPINYMLDQLTDPQGFLTKIQQLYESSEHDFETIHFKDGRIFEWFSSPLLKGGKITGRVWSFRDVTQRYRAEEALRASESQFRLIWENSPLGMRLTNEQGIMVKVNEAFCKIVDKPREELEGKPLSIVYEKHLQNHIQKRHQERFKARTVKTYFEQHLTLWNGSQIWVEVSNAFFKPEGKELLLLGIFLDITKRKNAEIALEQERAYFENLFQHSPEAIALCDNNGIIKKINTYFSKLFGYSPEEAIGKLIDKLVVPASQSEKENEIIRQSLQKNFVFTESIRMKKNRELVHVSILASPIKVGNNQLGVYIIYRDITDRKKSEEKLKNLLSEKDILLKEIYHRVKNNFQVITSLLNLQSKNIDNEQARMAFRESQNRIRTMALVHEHLYQSADLAHINFKEYLNSLVTNLYHSYVSRSNKINFHLEIADISLNIDQAIPCSLIINELISNAVKYAFPASWQGEPEINIQLKKTPGEKIVLIVKDNGIGIPQNFDIKNSNSLGLKLVTVLSENQLEGKITIKRKNGTIFKIQFSQNSD